MRKLILLLALGLAWQLSLLAQPTISIGDAAPLNGGAFCVPVTVNNFTNINSLQFTINYDAAVLTFTGATNFNTEMATMGNLGPALFDETIPGQISFGEWTVGMCNDPNNGGVTLFPDGQTIFELCFETSGTYGDQTDICLGNSPMPIRCTRNSTLCNNIGVLSECGVVTVGVRPFQLFASQENDNTGEQVCMDFTVSGWDELTSIQFSVNWDPSQLTFVSLIPNDEDIPNNILGATYGTPLSGGGIGPGEVTVSWSFFIQGQPQPVIPDGTTMFTICFDIAADCESIAPVVFSGDPTPIEVTNEDPDNPSEGQEIPYVFHPGAVLIGDCDPTGLELNLDCGAAVEINDAICVEVQAGSNFQAVRAMQYLMEWNPNILEFTGIQNVNLAGLGFPADFDTGNTNNGILGLDWSHNFPPTGQNISAGTVLYEVCFNVVGLGGDSPIQIITPGTSLVNGFDIGINPDNCAVQVTQPPGVLVELTDMCAPIGETNCVEVLVSNFESIVDFQFSLNWEDNVWTYVDIQNFHPDFLNASAANMMTFSTFGLYFEWDNPVPVDIPDGEALFELCFTPSAGASPGDTDILQDVSLPLAGIAISESSNGENVGVTFTSAEMCVLFPEGYALTATEELEGDWRDTLCMPFTVSSFDNILSTSFEIGWNPTGLQYVGVNETGAWPGLTFDENSTDVGALNGDFSSGSPLAITDDEVVFEVCFQLIDDPETCHAVSITDNPMPSVTTDNGPGNVVITNGEICILDAIVIDSIAITPVSCEGNCDGEVEIFVRQWSGQGFIGTTWHTEPFEQFTPLMLDNVCGGELSFTIFDNASGTSRTDTITIPVGGVQPEAVINQGDTVYLPCSPALALLTGSGSTGPDFAYNWYEDNAVGAPDGDGTNYFVDVTGRKILEVLNTQSGCVAYDTVLVLPAARPVADAGPDLVGLEGFSCANDTVTINGTAEGVTNPTVFWQIVSPVNAVIDSTTVETLNLTVLSPGRYRLVVVDPETGCTSEGSENDEVLVADERTSPVAVLESTSLEQDCSGNPSMFDATPSVDANDTLSIDYQWYLPDGTPDVNGLMAGYTELGTYSLVVTDVVSGCQDTIFADLVPNSDAPSVTAVAEALVFDCSSDTLDLSATIMPDTVDFNLSWTTVDGLLAEGTDTMATAQALAGGTYTILVTNPEDDCEASFTLEIADQTEPPTAAIDPNIDNQLTCTNNQIILNGAASTQGDTINYQWFDGDLDTPVAGAIADTLAVNTPGWYYLQVTNATTSCVALDSIEVTEDITQPMVILNELEPDLTCDNPTFTITATVANSTEFTFLGWTLVNGTGNIIEYSTDSLEITVDQPDQYTITVVDDLTGCEATAEAFVTNEQQAPPVLDVVSDTLSLSCQTTLVTMSGAGSDVGNEFAYLWETVEGTGTPITPDAIQTDVTEPGVYRFTVENMSSGCTSDTLVTILADTIRPILTALPVMDLTCAEPTTDLTVEVAQADEFTVLWTGLGGGTPLPAMGSTTTVSTTEDFQAVAINSVNGCTDTLVITVNGDIAPPAVNLAPIPEFDCADLSVTIDASGSGAPADFTDIAWVAVPGNDNSVNPADELTVEVSGPGDYQLSLTSAANGCTKDTVITVNVVDNPTLPSIVFAAEPADFGCDDETITIDASPTAGLADIAEVSWTGPGTVTPADGLVVTVDQPGDYVLTITTTGIGCMADSTITVGVDADVPVADAGEDLLLECGETSMLDGTASSEGEDFSYAWTVLSGADLTGDLTGPTPMVSGEGAYLLSVMNSANGCEDSDTVLVSLMLPDSADAGAAQAVCDSMAVLSANLPAGTDGVWTVSNNATLDDANSPSAMVTGLTPGNTTLTWTLSAPGCPDYSSDQVVISQAGNITATQDILTIAEGQSEGSVNVVDNDMLNGTTNWQIRVISSPVFGSFDSLTFVNTGNLNFSVGPGAMGVAVLEYEICSTDCPDICATASVNINVETDGSIFAPNTITPNDDGANDELIFDILLITPVEDAPDNELIVFSRWGDIVYQAKPYNNDWRGTSDDGNELPEGTYYYVLRVNIVEGIILEGDITIIR